MSPCPEETSSRFPVLVGYSSSFFGTTAPACACSYVQDWAVNHTTIDNKCNFLGKLQGTYANRQWSVPLDITQNRADTQRSYCYHETHIFGIYMQTFGRLFFIQGI